MPHPFEPLQARPGLGNRNARPTVLVCGQAGAPRPALMNLVEECGATGVPLPDWSGVDGIAAGCRSRIALVAIGAGAEDGTREGIAALRRNAFTVFVHGEGAESWPLGVRCRLYLLGCSTLLDSTSSEFLPQLRRALSTALRAALDANEETARVKQVMRGHGVVGESPAMLGLFRRLLQISVLSDLPTLITGETGTGKELLARALHGQDAKRRGGPFVAVNAGAISASLAETELFGHRRGAFTGAERDRKGLIRTAHGGVLFLDEVGELEGALQAKLLRVLQEGRVLAVGDDQEVPVSVRVIAATNADLPAMVADGSFRADLFHRLNVLSLHVPALRDRRADIPPLVEHFARLHQGLRRGGPVAIRPDFVEALSRLELRGNARQVENLVRRALVHNDGNGPLSLRDLPPDVWQQLAESADGDGAAATPLAPARDSLGLLAANEWNLARSLDSCERSIVEAALRISGGNQSQAARLLGVTPRSVYNKRHAAQRIQQGAPPPPRLTGKAIPVGPAPPGTPLPGSVARSADGVATPAA
jgi:DNA-binding NtrC family response regulator